MKSKGKFWLFCSTRSIRTACTPHPPDRRAPPGRRRRWKATTRANGGPDANGAQKDRKKRMNPVYTHDEVIANFQALVDNWDFSAKLKGLGIGAIHIMLRKRMLLEFKGLFAGLWRLALTRSFPEDGQQIFESYLERCLSKPKSGKKGQQLVERSRQYAEMLTLRGDADFSEVSRHLTSFLNLPESARKSATLKLALEIRQTYNIIFERMI
jgi:hypothetical protein